MIVHNISNSKFTHVTANDKSNLRWTCDLTVGPDNTIDSVTCWRFGSKWLKCDEHEMNTQEHSIKPQFDLYDLHKILFTWKDPQIWLIQAAKILNVTYYI